MWKSKILILLPYKLVVWTNTEWERGTLNTEIKLEKITTRIEEKTQSKGKQINETIGSVTQLSDIARIACVVCLEYHIGVNITFETKFIIALCSDTSILVFK